MIKVNAVERLRAELRLAPRWGGEHIAMGTNTDPYQPVEGRYRLTRGIVEALTEAGNPFSILTKSTLILRDLDVLAEAARARTGAGRALDRLAWTRRLAADRAGTPNPLRRVERWRGSTRPACRAACWSRRSCPGISDDADQLDAVVRACVEAGAASITPMLLHLRPGVREHYLAWLAGAPARAGGRARAPLPHGLRTPGGPAGAVGDGLPPGRAPPRPLRWGCPPDLPPPEPPAAPAPAQLRLL